jgi:molecular chaperone GrpE (heat shock protein)
MQPTNEEELLHRRLKSELQKLKEDLARKETEIEQLKNENKKTISVIKKKQWVGNFS